MKKTITRRHWLKSSAALGLGIATFSRATPDARRDNGIINIGSRRELFVDDFMIQSLDNVHLQLHHPTPREVAIEHDKPWEGTGSGYHTVFRDGDLYRMYYRGWHIEVTPEKLITNKHKMVTCYAESNDGIHWHKPDLGLVEFAGSMQNNIILQGLGTHNFIAFRDENPNCPVNARYKGLAGVIKEGGLFAFKSKDGIYWSLMQEKPVITNGAFDSQNLAFWDPALGKYRAYWRIFTEGITTAEVWKPKGHRAIRTAVSDDYLNWTDEADLEYVDSPSEQLYTNQIKSYERAPHILIGFPARYVERGWSDSMRALPDPEKRELRAAAHLRYGTALTEGLLMASHDGVSFKRWNEAFLPPGIERPGTWQYGQQNIAWHTVQTRSALPDAPDELSLYASEDYWHGKGSVLRRYSLRLDGFVSVYADMQGGQLITRPFTFKGKQLEINFSTSAAGGLKVEIQTASGQPIKGFTVDDCEPHFGDAIDRPVTWKQGADVSALSGQPVRLLFRLKDAHVYAFRFAE